MAPTKFHEKVYHLIHSLQCNLFHHSEAAFLQKPLATSGHQRPKTCCHSESTLSHCKGIQWLLITPFILSLVHPRGWPFLVLTSPLRVGTLKPRLLPFLIFLPISSSVNAHALVASIQAEKSPSCPLASVFSTHLWCVLLSSGLSSPNYNRPQALVTPSPQASHFA